MARDKKKRAYGLWTSPLGPSAMAGAKGIKDVWWAEGETLLWVESRDGHSKLLARDRGDAPRAITQTLNLGGGVGYGGGDGCARGRDAYFAARDGRLYRVNLDRGLPTPLTPGFGRVASPAASPDGAWVVYVHTDGGRDALGAVDAEGERWPVKLASGADFYMQPTWSPGSDFLSWVEWDHPNMPWSGTRLMMGEVERGRAGLALKYVEHLAGADEISVMQPEFSPDGQHLAYISDEDGWWHLYLRRLSDGRTRRLTRGEFEVGGPAWIQGLRAFAWRPDSRGLYAIKNERGCMEVLDVGVDGEVGVVEALKDYSAFDQPIVHDDGRLAVLASSSTVPQRLVTWAPGEAPRVEARSSAERLRDEQLAVMEPVAWTATSESGEVEIFGNLYRPTNPRFYSDGKPPAMVMVHGGPTSQRTARFEPANQFFATRGFTVLDVNYRGSTGYGRSYRDALLGHWGVYDVEDAVSAARYLVDEGLADPDRVVIMGGSAGGYTVLQALCSRPGVFAAGISKYGISNLFSLSMDTHKFEQHYNDGLVGALPAASATFRARSPLYHAAQIRDPVAIFQGADDKVVPLNQAEQIVDALRQTGARFEYEVYEGEGHGWRRAETIEAFYRSVMDFLRAHVIFAA